MFKVQKKQCSTCIYKKDSCFDIKELESQIKDRFGFFKGFRACHHVKGKEVCCRGFWNKHRNNFQAGQIAERLGLVELVNVDVLKG